MNHINSVKNLIKYLLLPRQAKLATQIDKAGLGLTDPGVDVATQACIKWIYRAQDCSTSHDGGVANHFSLLDGWGESYPETSGYIVPTLLEWSALREDNEARLRAKTILDWLVKIQFPSGGFQGSTINAVPKVPVTFNTGQILLGLAAGTKHFGHQYEAAMHKAARWLTQSMDDDGAWRKHSTPFAALGEKAYETHVAWGLLEAERVAPAHGYAEAAMRNMKWAVTKQRPNGWFADCCLDQPSIPLTHTIGYVVRGLLEGWRFSHDPKLFAAVILTSDSILKLISSDGRLAGRFDSNWNAAVDWVCVTGSSQIAHNYLTLYEFTQDERYLKAARSLNQFVRRSIQTVGDPSHVGGVRGSFPINGSYGPYRYLNWAAKFTVDANLAEEAVLARRIGAGEMSRPAH